MDLSMLSKIFPSQDDPNATEKNLHLGLLGLSLMQQGQPTANPNQSFGVGLLNEGFSLPKDASAQNLTDAASHQAQNFLANGAISGDYSQQPSLLTPPPAPENGNVAQSLPTDQGSYLHMLQQQAALAHPGNPLMQQIAITQAIQESGIHPSKLATQNNNLFGIKATGTSGMTNMMTNEYENGQNVPQSAGFGRNATVADSFIQHKNLLEHNKRYQGVVNAQDPYQAFSALQQAGYATDPHYAQQLSQVYRHYVAPMYAN